MAIKIYADAGSNLFKDIIEKRNAEIKVVNMSLTIDEKIYQCYEDDINVDQFSHSFYQKMREGITSIKSITMSQSSGKSIT